MGSSCLPISRDALPSAGLPAPSPVLSPPNCGPIGLNPKLNRCPVPQPWGLPRAYLGTMTLETREGRGTGRDRVSLHFALCWSSQTRTWAQVEGCQAGSFALGGSPMNGESLVLETENLQPGPGRLLGVWKILCHPRNAASSHLLRGHSVGRETRKSGMEINLILPRPRKRGRAVPGEGSLPGVFSSRGRQAPATSATEATDCGEPL